jgi:hypothetical protein
MPKLVISLAISAVVVAIVAIAWSASSSHAPAGRHLGEEFALKYMRDKFKVFESPSCERWEDLGVGRTQSVLCTFSNVLAIYCRAGDGRAPSCEFVVDRRPTPPAAAPAGAADESQRQPVPSNQESMPSRRERGDK